MLKYLGLVPILLLLLLGCSQATSTGKLHKVGLLVPETINDQVWGTKGYKGLLKIQSEFNVDVFYKEGMDNEQAVRQAVDEFRTKGVNLVFGHGSEYESFFNSISKDYPDIHFVFFNGETENSNVTSLNFESNAMGFFAGMVAGKMTKANHVGILASFEWQPEVDGYFEGAYYQNQAVDVNIKFVEHWDDVHKALQLLDEMIQEGVDVVYVAGDGYNVPAIEKLKAEGLFAIGYISDQSDLGEGAVLTSTVQHVDKLYELIAKKFNSNELKSGTLYFDFQDDVISLGQFSPLVEESFVKELEKSIENYKKTGKLPNQ
ncbi:BMP family ABC transporter substrate-binding protein [Metabacillus fastidiosus]|uniref:BMP family ABC transporter substrate-binding protein n=1 Tax=Metabacillus fastidiosus TaxID=1458 RepID=A0ABU6P1E4_9BACI|nr:BMP family ABC transporter substrate-binding protein [Metabacillus fastidiosus]MED4403174.1 BMP family ABC transporter substrate-binding protein [Metabacillus fastidiosus]MED4455407.1 BMP family ABC transporter substrate-binding protein [Metabacillus fastidiosus]MED4461598.1 BMP family ABC transporter substrate-binding protein [Metabacillus fastidiosus]